jgi:hypothetical protein
MALRAVVDIRGGRVSRYGYSLMVEDGEFPGNEAVVVQVQGANRAGFPGVFGFMRYDEIGISPVRVPSNKQTTVTYAAFTLNAQPEDINSGFDIITSSPAETFLSNCDNLILASWMVTKAMGSHFLTSGPGTNSPSMAQQG